MANEPTANAIYQRRIAYMLCMGEMAYKRLQAIAVNNTEAAEDFAYKEWLAGLGVKVMDAYAASGTSCPQPWCPTLEQVCCIMKKLDQLCTRCGCEAENGCIVFADHTVVQAVDASFQPSAVPGETYLIVTDTSGWGGSWASHVDELVTDTTFTTLFPGDVIYDTTNDTYWGMGATTTGLYFPLVDVGIASFTATMVSYYPEINAQFGRNVKVELSDDGIVWYTLYNGPESVLSSPYTIPVANEDAIFVRVTYLIGSCTYGPFQGVIPPSPCAPSQQLAYGADASEQDTLPNTLGIQYLIVSDALSSGNEWASNVGSVATGDGAGGWTYVALAAGEKVRTDLDYYGGISILWIGTGTSVAYYYPPMCAAINATTLSLVTPWTPEGHDVTVRNVLVEVSDNTNTWQVAYNGPETGLIGTPTFTVPAGMTQARVTYLGVCPGPAPMSTLAYAITPTAQCAADGWNLVIGITGMQGWTGAQIVPTVNGTPGTPVALVMGNTTIGPLEMSDFVSVVLDNSGDTCDISSSTYHDPRLPAYDALVYQAVDASFEASALPGIRYLIVSDTTDAGNAWAAQVGDIWTGSTFVTPADGDITLATDPGDEAGYWQMSGGTQYQVFPRPTFTYNTVTMAWVATMPPLPPYSAAMTLFIQGVCSGIPFNVFGSGGNLTGADFVPTPFSTACSVDQVTGRAYFTFLNPSCPLLVPAIVESFTPTGDPDPNFQPFGVDDAITDFVEQPNGAFLASGFFTYFDPDGTPVRANGIVRINSDGTLDTTYNNVANNPALPEAGPGRRGFASTRDLIGNPDCDCVTQAMVKDSQGRIIVCGNFTEYNGVAAGGIIRLLPDGSRDTSFAGTGLLLGAPYSPYFTGGQGLAIDEFDRVVCTGWFSSYNGVDVGNIVMINPADGSINTTFNTNSLGGFNFRVGVARYDRSTQTFVVVTAQPPAAGYGTTAFLTTAEKAAIRINGGANPGGFNSLLTIGTQLTEPGAATHPDLFQQADGKFLFSGSFTDYDGNAANRILRVFPDGSIDTVFAANVGTAFDGQTYCAEQMPNGQIMVGSTGTVYTDSTPTSKNVLGLIRLTTGGFVDATWSIGTGFTGGGSGVTALQVTSLGALIVGGNFLYFNGVRVNHIVKL